MPDELFQACVQDLERLLPYWLSLEAEEQGWHLQRWCDRLQGHSELLPLFCQALLQRVTLLENRSAGRESAEYHLCRALWMELS